MEANRSWVMFIKPPLSELFCHKYNSQYRPTSPYSFHSNSVLVFFSSEKHYANCKKPTFHMKTIAELFTSTSQVDKQQGPVEDKETQATSNNSDSIVEQTEQ